MVENLNSIEKIYKLYLKSEGIEIDSRKIESNKLFFALKGEKVDGHDYVKSVIEKNNVYAIIDNESHYVDDRTILVSDVISCLQSLARYHRLQFNIPVIGITGSNGKTTTKELIYQVLKKKYKVHATQGNYNNHLGVPLTILMAPLSTQIMVIEMGANHIGEIQELCEIALPNFGLITNIGNAHIEGFGSYEGVITAKTELYKFLSLNGGTIFYNKDDQVLEENLPKEAVILTYPSSDISIMDNGLNLILNNNLDDTQYVTGLYGIYNASNIQAAYIIGDHFEVPSHLTLEAISDYEPKMNRSQIDTVGSTVIIMDAYNANPSSMKLGIKSLATLDDNREKILILGDMKELGDQEVQYHEEIISFTEKYDWKKILLVGPIFSKSSKDSYDVFDNVDHLIEYASSHMSLFEDTIILLKASRSIQLERFKKACFA